jgi:hypothetical protein
VSRRSALLALLLAALMLVPTAASATGRRSMTFQLTSVTRVTTPHDLPPKGRENKGDYIVYKALLVAMGPLFGKVKNRAVGYEEGTVTYTSATKARLRGISTFEGQGTVTFSGPMKELSKGRTSVPITGGTGKFHGAKGVIVIGPGDTKATNTYRLSLPCAGCA